MIKSIRHKGLRLLWEDNDTSKLPKDQIKKIMQRLTIINNLELVPQDLGAFPGLKGHKLSGDLKDYWSIRVTGNYRIVFIWDGQHASDLDYLDYH
jgi:proteic killer suppression protein